MTDLFFCAGIYEAKIYDVKYDYAAKNSSSPKEWLYRVHFLGWKKSNDLWLPASALIVRETEAAGDPEGGPPKKKSKGRGKVRRHEFGCAAFSDYMRVFTLHNRHKK